MLNTKMYLKYKDSDRFSVNVWREVYHANNNQRTCDNYINLRKKHNSYQESCHR